MALLRGLLWPFQIWNDVVLEAGRWVAMVCMVLMVTCILVQVFFRYVLNNALPWPDEAARFFMLWMTGLIGPLAYRRGGFVAIDLALRMMNARIAALISLILLVISGVVLYWAIGIGYGEVTSLTARGKTASLFIYDFTSGEWEKMPRKYVFYSLFVGVILLFIVNIELILRSLITVFGQAQVLRPLIPGDDVVVE